MEGNEFRTAVVENFPLLANTSRVKANVKKKKTKKNVAFSGDNFIGAMFPSLD